MKEQFIPYREALTLRELGFDEECFKMYSPSDNGVIVHPLNVYKGKNSSLGKEFKGYSSAPLWQQAFDWFREKYSLFSTVDRINNVTEIGYRFNISTIKSNMVVDKFPLSRKESIYYKEYNEAKQACLEKLIEIVKNENKSDL